MLRTLLLIPPLIYAVLTPLGVVWSYFHATLAWHPDSLLIYEVVGLTFCLSAYVVKPWDRLSH